MVQAYGPAGPVTCGPVTWGPIVSAGGRARGRSSSRPGHAGSWPTRTVLPAPPAPRSRVGGAAYDADVADPDRLALVLVVSGLAVATAWPPSSPWASTPGPASRTARPSTTKTQI